MPNTVALYGARDHQLRQFVSGTVRRAARRGRRTDIRSVHALDLHLRPFGDLCHWCGTEPWEQLDHVVPLASGGEDLLANIVPACARCNSTKAQHDVEAWLAGTADMPMRARRRADHDLQVLGWSTAAIAAVFGVSPGTIRRHRRARAVPTDAETLSEAAKLVRGVLDHP